MSAALAAFASLWLAVIMVSAADRCRPLTIGLTQSEVRVNSRLILLVMGFLPLFLVSGLRVDVGTDYQAYVYIWRLVKEGFDYFGEIGFGWLVEGIAALTDDFVWLMLITSLLAFAPFYVRICRSSPMPAFSLLMFFCMGHYFSAQNIIRQYIALGIIFAAFPLMAHKRRWAYRFAVTAALLFHKTAALCYVFYYLLRLKPSVKKYALFSALGVAGMLLRSQAQKLLFFFYPNYEGSAFDGQSAPLLQRLFYLALCGWLAFLAYTVRGSLARMDNANIWLNSIFFTALCYLCFFWVAEINRIALYLEIYLPLAAAYFLSAMKNKRQRLFYGGVTACAMLVYVILSLAVGRWGIVTR